MGFVCMGVGTAILTYGKCQERAGKREREGDVERKRRGGARELVKQGRVRWGRGGRVAAEEGRNHDFSSS